jgi:hypothetical protein
MTSNEGPRILWEQLKGKNVKTNDGHDVGEIKEITQNYIRLEKGIVNKDKSWIPKYLTDAYDGKVLWLVISNDDLAKDNSYTTEPDREQYTHDFEAFKSTPYGKKAMQLPDFDQNIRVTEERKSNTSRSSGDEYRNIRDLE